MKLSAPLNSTLTVRAAETAWATRPGSATELTEAATIRPPGQVGLQSKRASQPNAVRGIQATQVSGPLDRFRKPSVQPPTLKRENAEKPSDSGTRSTSLGDQVVDRRADADSPVNGSWQNRTEGQRAADPAASSSTEVTATQPDGFRQAAIEGNWIARDAINRVQPLFDPESATMAPQAGNRTKPIEIVSPLNLIKLPGIRRWQNLTERKPQKNHRQIHLRAYAADRYVPRQCARKKNGPCRFWADKCSAGHHCARRIWADDCQLSWVHLNGMTKDE